MIQVTNLSKEINSKKLFSNLTFKISNKSRIGLIGRNGMGKTTLLKIILGIEHPTSGTVTIQDEKIGYLSQEFDFDMDQMVGEYVESIADNFSEHWIVEKYLGMLNFNADEYQQLKTLSGGEKMKLKLAEILYREPTMIFLDEPTNHLDIEGIAWFKKFLNKFKGGFVMISHDRDLLNDTVNRIYEIDQNQLLDFPGNYDNYIEQKQNWIIKTQDEYKRYVKRKEKLERLLFRAMTQGLSNAGDHGIGSVKKRIEREVTRREKKEYVERNIGDLSISGSVFNKKLVLRLNELHKKYGEKTVFNGANLEIRGSEKLWLFGQNGQGKTTLIKSILGEVKPDSGTIQIGDNLTIGYFAQKQEPEKSDIKLIDYFSRETSITYYSVPSVLQKYLFEKEEMNTPLRLLSPGQQARLKFAIFVNGSKNGSGYNFLILDEPANHLDIPTKEVIEEAINSFQGACILISHDVYMVKNIEIDRVVELKNGSLNELK